MSTNENKFEKVYELLGDLEESIVKAEEGCGSDENVTLDSETISEISEEIAEAINDEGYHLIDDYELGISGREIEIEDVTFDSQRINDIIEEYLTKRFGTKVSIPKKKKK